MDQALDRLTMGPERLGLERRQPVHRRMATHEVGLAMTSHLLRRLESAQLEFCDRVSIVPRGEVCLSALVNVRELVEHRGLLPWFLFLLLRLL